MLAGPITIHKKIAQKTVFVKYKLAMCQRSSVCTISKLLAVQPTGFSY